MKKGRREEVKETHGASPPEEAQCERKDKRRHDYDEIFEAWWKHYPKKSGKEKAAKAYAHAAQRLTHNQLLEAVKKYAQSDRGKGKQRYIPNPATWLNAGHYEDAPRVWSDNPPPEPAQPATPEKQEPQEPTRTVLMNPIERPDKTMEVPEGEAQEWIDHNRKLMAEHLRTCERWFCKVCEAISMGWFRDWAVETYGEEKCGFKPLIYHRRWKAEEDGLLNERTLEHLHRQRSGGHAV